MDETQGIQDGRATAEAFKAQVLQKISERIIAANLEAQRFDAEDRRAFANYWHNFVVGFETAIGGSCHLPTWKI